MEVVAVIADDDADVVAAVVANVVTVKSEYILAKFLLVPVLTG